MKKHTISLITVLLSIAFASCNDDKTEGPSFSWPKNGEGVVLPYSILTTLSNGVEVRNGGYGSAMVAHPTKEGHFYCLTDRGPNADYTGTEGDGKKFPVPNYTPRIGHFKLNAKGTVELVEEILLKNPSGNPITGLPNPEGRGATGETPYDNNGKVLDYDDYGLDGEGLVALANGEFWVSDEYGPHIVHYDKTGKEMERISPVNVDTGGRKIPAVYKRRRANRGMEGLCITPDGSTLVGIMQSTLYNPSKAKVVNKTLTRIITFDLSIAKTKEYLYKQEKDWNANSEITALSNNTFLVIERDGNFSGEGETQKHIYKIDITNATDVSGDFNDIDGKKINGKALEEMEWKDIEAAGISLVSKKLVVDVVASLPNKYPHDKLEGIWYISDTKIGVINDDDFGVTAKGPEIIQKILPGTSDIDQNTLYILDVSIAQ